MYHDSSTLSIPKEHNVCAEYTKSRITSDIGQRMYLFFFRVVEEEAEAENHIESLFIDSIDKSVENKNKYNPWYEKILINDKEVIVKLDTGADCDVLSEEMLLDLNICKNALKPLNNEKYKAYGGSELHAIGKINLMCKFNNKEKQVLTFIVIGGNSKHPPTIIGGPSLQKFQLIKRVNLININMINNIEKILEEYMLYSMD